MDVRSKAGAGVVREERDLLEVVTGSKEDLYPTPNLGSGVRRVRNFCPWKGAMGSLHLSRELGLKVRARW